MKTMGAFLAFMFLVGIAMAQETNDMLKLKRAQDALQEKTQAEDMAAIDPAQISSIGIIVTPIRPSGVSSSREPKITIYIRPDDNIFNALLAVIKDAAADRAGAAKQRLEEIGVISIAPVN